MALLKGLRERKKRAVVIACSNFPDDLDISVDSEMSSQVYFLPATEVLLTGIARGRGYDDAATEIAREYVRACNGGVYACGSSVPRRPWIVPSAVPARMRHLRRGSPADCAAALVDLNRPPTIEQVDGWAKRFKERIERSNGLRALIGMMPRDVDPRGDSALREVARLRKSEETRDDEGAPKSPRRKNRKKRSQA